MKFFFYGDGSLGPFKCTFYKTPLMVSAQHLSKGELAMTSAIDDEEIERVIDIIGDGALTAEAQERLHHEGLCVPCR